MADLLAEAQELYQEALEVSRTQRKQIEEDLAFSDPSNPQQWDADLKAQRESDPGGSRPCLVFDQTGQYVSNVAGQVEQRPPALHAIPVDGGADRRVAEKLDGFFRHIEHTSRAQQHYARALTSAARAGVGYLIVRPTYVNRALGWQEPSISSEGDPLRVVLDPWSVELDGSDANFGFHLTPFSQRYFKQTFGDKAEKISFGDEERSTVDDERESILVAEAWRIEEKKRKVLVVQKGEDEVDLTEEEYALEVQNTGIQPIVLRTYDDKYKCVKWARMSGAEILSKEAEFPASGIGIIPVYGYVGWSDGRMKYCGIPRRAMEPQRAYNFHMSEARAYVVNAPKSPWLTSVRSIKGLEPLWDKASVEQRANLPFHDLDDMGPITPPSRPQVSVNLQNHTQGAEQALRDIQAAIGMYQANLGAPSNETSGVAIDSRKQQGEASTAHFPSHLAASIAQVGKLVVEMIPRLVDTKRQLRVLGVDGAQGSVTMDPSQEEAIQESEQGITINPNVGRYDVRVVVGAAYATQRLQAQEAFSSMMNNELLAPLVAPFWAQNLDIRDADKLQQVFTAAAPEPVRAILSPEANQPSQADLTAQVQQLQAALQEATALAEEAQADADQFQTENDTLKAEKSIQEKEFAFKLAAQVDANQLKYKEFELKEREQALHKEDRDLSRQDSKEQFERQEAEKAAKEAEPKSDPEQDDAMEEALAKAVESVVQRQEETTKIVQSLAQGQEQNAKLMQTVIKLLQAPRKREPKYDSKGEMIGSVETIDIQPETLQ